MRRIYNGSEIILYIETFGKLLGMCVYIYMYMYITEPWTALNVFLCTLFLSLTHTHPHTLCLAYKHCLSLPLTVVLAALDDDIAVIINDTVVRTGDIPVIIGNSTNVFCPFSSGTDFGIYWIVDGHRYDCDISDTPDGGIYCNNSAPLSQSILSIEDNNSLRAGGHVVECVLEQTIPDNFKNDPSLSH